MPIFIDLFAGCGGLSLGLTRSGWRGLFAIEREGNAFSTLKANLIDGTRVPQFCWPEWLPKQACDISDLVQRYASELEGLQGKVDLVAGGPPCQGFSTLGRRDILDPRNHLFELYLEVVGLVRPTFLLLENVPAFDHLRSQDVGQDRAGNGLRKYSALVKNGVRNLGYETYSGVIRAADFGVAQIRPRYFIVAVRREVASRLADDPFTQMRRLQKNFLEDLGLDAGMPIGVASAISDLEVGWAGARPSKENPRFFEIHFKGPRTSYQTLLHGGVNGIEPDSLRLTRHRPATVHRLERILQMCAPGSKLPPSARASLGIKKHSITRLDPDRPAPTLSTLPDDFVHYSEPRILTVREMARLQSFPDWFTFQGKYTTGDKNRVTQCPRYTQVGNAVAPFVAEALGRALHVMHDQTLGTAKKGAVRRAARDKSIPAKSERGDSTPIDGPTGNQLWRVYRRV